MIKILLLFKQVGGALFVADPPGANSTTDTDTKP